LGTTKGGVSKRRGHTEGPGGEKNGGGPPVWRNKRGPPQQTERVV